MLTQTEAHEIRKKLYRIALTIPEHHTKRLEAIFDIDDSIAANTTKNKPNEVWRYRNGYTVQL